MASQSVERFKYKVTNMTDDRQTDVATEKCVGIGGIACAEEAIPPKNHLMHFNLTRFQFSTFFLFAATESRFHLHDAMTALEMLHRHCP